jgi:O-glycosyl hydrolase
MVVWKYFGFHMALFVDIGTVMPQNEFNSAQPFPSCCWMPEGLARFISFLGPEMQKLSVDVFFGTMERPNEKLVDVTLLDPRPTKYIQGVEVQWAGKRAIPGIRSALSHLMKHLSRFVKPGAKRLDIMSLTGYENVLVFANPDESVVIMAQNDLLSGTASSRESRRQSDRFHARGRLVQYVRG